MIKVKTYFIIVLFLLGFCVVMFLLFGMDNYKDEKIDTTIIVGNNVIWKRHANKWSKVSSFSEIQKLNWQKYHIFTNQEEIGQYYLWYDDKWYVFDDDKNAINVDGDIFAYNSNNNLLVYPFVEEEFEDDISVDTVLNNYDIKDREYTSHYRISIDFDSDGVDEKIYVLSNVFAYDFEPSKYFSIVYMVKNNEIYPIYDNLLATSSFDGCKPHVDAIIDSNLDGKLELILGCSGYSIGNTTNTMYEFVNNEFKSIISSE